MGEVFLSGDVTALLENKYVVIMGDSVQRSIYKDLVCMLQQNEYMSDTQLRCKGDLKFMKDKLIAGGKLATLSNGAGYREEREYQTDYHLVKFYFVTRCYYNYVDKILDSIKSHCILPDVFILNSCVWDISRYGPNSVAKYKENLEKLVKKLKSTLPEECLVIWNTTLPISSEAKGGFLVPEVEFMTNSLHLDILQANLFAQQKMTAAGYDVLDLHFYLRHHIHRRAEDGIHWDMTAHRRISNLLMSHISEAWGRSLPSNVDEYTSADTALLAKSVADDARNNNQNIALSIAARPKVKAKRRKKKGNSPTLQNAMNKNNVRVASPLERINHPSPQLQNSVNMMNAVNSAHMMNAMSPHLINSVNIRNALRSPMLNSIHNGGSFNDSPEAQVNYGAANGFPSSKPFSVANVNFPMMVNPMERYGGPITSSPYHSSPSDVGVYNDNAMWDHGHGGPKQHILPSSLLRHQAAVLGQQQRQVSYRPGHIRPQCLEAQFW